jgi:hypothetical protein
LAAIIENSTTIGDGRAFTSFDIWFSL